MADPGDPIEPTALVPLGLPDNLVLGGPGKDSTGASPVMQALQRNLLRNFGMNEDRLDPMTGAMAAPLSPFAEKMQQTYPASRPMPHMMPEFAGGLSGLPEAAPAPVTVDFTSLMVAARTGFDQSPLGSIIRAGQMSTALSMTREPGYDYFNDRQISDAGMGSQMILFDGSMSREMTRWMIQRYQEKARLGEYIDRMGMAGGIAKFAGGILGDPLTYLPATIGLKSVELAERFARGALSGAELKLISSQSVLWGSVADGMANMTVQAGAHVMGQLMGKAANPTTSLDDVLDSLFIPTAIAGSAQFVTSAFTRRFARGLKEEVREAGFLRGYAASGARYVPDDFVGPVIHPSDEAAAALVSRYDEAARRMERTSVWAPGEARTNLPGDSDYAAGKFGPQKEVPYNGLPRNGAFAPGSLATNYGPLRTEEALTDPATDAILRTTGKHPGLVVGGVDTGKGIPRTLKGGWEGGTPVGEAVVKKTRLVDKTAAEAKPAALPPDLPADTRFGREPVGYNDRGEAIYERRDGSRTIMLEGNRPIEEPINDIGKERGQLFGGAERGERFKLAGETDAGEASEGSVGAALSPQSQIYRREVLLAQGRMAPTGIGMENLPLDPVSRTFQGLSAFAMQLVSDLVSTGGRLTVGNLAGHVMGTRAPIEMLIEANWGKPVVDLIRRQHDAWHEYKQLLAKAGGQTGVQAVDYAARTDTDRLAYEVGQAAKNLINRGDPGITFNAFRLRVAKALNNGDVDELTDAVTPFVNREAGAQRAFYSKTRDLAVEHKVFDEAYEKSRDLAQSEVRALKKEADEVKARSVKEGWSVTRTREAEEALIARTEDAQFRLRQTEEELAKLKKGGPTLNGTAPSYRPRLWDVGELTRLEGDFVSEISEWLQMKSGGTLDTAEAVRQAKEIHSLVSRQNPVYDRGDMEALFKSVASPNSAMARSLTIPDKMIEKYLINDSEVLLRYHARQMGTAIEMKQRFGSLDLKEQIAEIEQEYRGLMKRSADEAASPPGAAYKAQFEKAEGVPWAPLPSVADLQKMSDGAIADMQVLRDRLYGTHGAAADPHTWTSRTIRMAKQFANITLLGMSGISSLGDFVRPLMTEGLDSMYGHGLRTLMSDTRGTIMNLARKDMELAGTGMDLMNNVRALQAADTGDVFASRGRLEHALGQANNWFFVANGLNQLTEWSKRWSSVMIQGRMNEALELFARTGTGDKIDIARLAAANIDHTMARRIGQQLEAHGVQFDNIRLANLGEWDDEVASELYKSMLFQHINRTVVTPGLGDRSNWMSTELGSLVSQYKAWGVANLVRSLQSGLQEGGNNFWYGAAAAVGFAIILNEVRSRLFYDHSTFDRPATAVIADGVDRSSILGWFSDANRAVETLTGNRLGFKPLMGAVQPHPIDIPQAVGTVAGPAAGQATRAASVLNDFIRDHPTAKTYNNWRTLMPGNTLPYLDPVYDRAISDGNFRRSMERSGEKKERLFRE